MLYALALIGAFVVPTAVGGNADRLGALVAGPIAACALLGRRPSDGARWRTASPCSRRSVYWQANAPVTDFASPPRTPP